MPGPETKPPPRGREFDLLEHRYRDSGEWAKLADLYKESSHQMADKRMAVQRLLQAGALYRDKVKNGDGAKRCFEQSVTILNNLVNATDNRLAQSDLLCDLAKIYLEILQDRERAIEAYVRAFELDPQKTHLMSVLGDIYAQREGWSDVVTRFSTEAKGAASPEMKAQYLGEVADVYSFILNDPQRAITTYREMLKLDSNNQKAIEALESLLVKERKWTELVTFYEDLKSKTKDRDEIISLCTKLGMIFKDKLHEPVRAIAVYEEIIARQPNNFRIASKLEELRGDKGLWSKNFDEIEAKLRTAKSANDRVPLLVSEAAIAETYLGKEHLASERLAEALRFSPANPEVLRRAVDLWKKNQSWGEIARAYEEAAEKTNDNTLRVQALRELAEISFDRLKDPTRAIAAYEALLQHSPNDPASRQQLTALYEQQRLWDPLAQLLETSVHSAKPSERMALWLRLAKLREEELANLDSATEAYEEILKVDPHHPEALASLERLYPKQRRWKDLVSIYERRAEQLAKAEEKGAVYLALAKTFEEKVGDLKGAAAAYERALPLVEDSTKIASRVEQIYFNEKLWKELAALYERLIPRAKTPEEQAKLLFKSAELYEQKLDRVGRAKECLDAILERNPSDILALRSLERMAERGENWKELIQIYRRQTDITSDPAEKLSIYLKAGEVFLSRLQDEKRAETCFRKVVELDNTNRVALNFLADFYRRQALPEELLMILETQASATAEPKPLSEIYVEMGKVLESSLHKEMEAIQQYEKALELDPTLPSARQALARIYQSKNRWDELIRTYMGELEQERDRIRGANLAATIGRLFQKEMGNAEQAIAYFQRSLDLNSSNLEVVVDLTRTLEKSGRAKDSLPYYERIISLSGEPRESARAALRIGEIYLDVLHDPHSAASWYERALTYDSESKVALTRLTQLYESLQNWKGLLHVYEKILPTLSGGEASKLHYRVGDLFEHRLGATDRALVSYQIASELDSKFIEPISAMRRLLKAEENWGEYLKLTQAESELVAEPEKRAALLYESGILWRERFLQNERAIRSFQDVLALAPNDGAALEQLSELYEIQNNLPALQDATERALGRVKDPARRTNLLLRLGKFHLLTKKDPATAAPLYREILALDPKHKEAISALVEITKLLGDWKVHLSTLQMQLEIETTKEGKTDVLFQMAEAWKGPLRSNDNAVETLHALLRLDPSNHRALLALGETVSQPNEWHKISRPILEGLKEKKSLNHYVSAALSIASIDHERFKRTDSAIVVLREAMEKTGDREDLLDRLIALYEASGEAVAMADAAMRRAQLLKVPAERAKALVRVAEMWSESLDNPRQAISALGEARKLEPENPLMIDRLIALYLRTGDWKKADKLISETLEGDPLTSTRAQDLAFQRATLLAERLKQPDQAISILEEIIPKSSDPKPALELAARLYEAKDDWENVVTCMARLAEQTHGGDTVELRRSLADIYEHRLHDLNAAVKQFELILRAVPRDRASLAGLERLHEEKKDYAALASVLQQQITLTRDAADAARIYRKLGDVWARGMKDTDRSLGFLERSLEHDPSQTEILTRLIEQYRKLKRPLELAEALRKQAKLVGPDKAIPIYEELADLWRSTLANPIQAQEYLETILKMNPTYRPALLKLADIHLQNENYRAHGWTLGQLAETAKTPAEKVEAWLALAELQQNRLNSRHDAMETYRRVLKLDPKQSKALDRLRDLFGKDERWKDLAEVLKTLSKEVDPRASATILRQLAMIEVDRLKQPERAMATLTQLRKFDPENVDVLHQLQQLFEQYGKFSDLAGLFEEELRGKVLEERRLELLKRLGSLYDERLKNPTRAIECYEERLGLVASDMETLSRLESLYRRQGREEDAARALEQKAAQLPPGDERTAILESLADRYWTKGERGKDALRCYRLLAQDPAQKRRAFERIAGIEERLGLFSELIITLRSLIAEIPEPREQTIRLLQLGRVHYEKLNDPKTAEKIFFEARKLQPHQPEIVDTLSEFYRSTKHWQKAATLLGEEVQATKDIHRRAPLLRELADLWRGPLKDPAKAVALYEELVRIAPHEMDAVSILAELYFERKAFKEAAPLHERLVKVAALRKDPPRASRLFYQMGTIARELGKNDEAILHLNQALLYDPTHAESVRGLAELFYDLKQWDNAIRMLRRAIELGRAEDRAYIDKNYYLLIQTLDRLGREDEAIKIYEEAHSLLEKHLGITKLAADLYRRAQKWTQARATYLRVLELSKTNSDRHDALFALAEIAFQHFNDIQAAREGLTSLLRDDPNHKRALELFVSVCEKEKEWPAALSSIEQLTQLEQDPEKLSQLWLRLGRIHDRETGDLRKARESYLRSIEVGTGDSSAMEALQGFCKTESDWRELSQLYERKSQTLQDSGKRKQAANFKLALGYLYRQHLRDDQRAIQAFRAAVTLDPSAEAMLALGRVLALNPATRDEAIRIFGQLTAGASQKLSLLKEIVDFYTSVGKKDRALVASTILQFRTTRTSDPITDVKHSPLLPENTVLDLSSLYDLLPESCRSPWGEAISEINLSLIPLLTSGQRSAAMLSATDVVPNQTTEAVAEYSKRLGLDGKKISVYYSAAVNDIGLELTSPPSVGVGPGLYKLDKSIQRFFIAFHLARLRLGSLLLSRMSSTASGELLEALRATGEEKRPAKESVAALVATLQKGLSRKDVKTLSNLFSASVTRPPLTPAADQLGQDLERAAIRLAYFLFDDLASALRAVSLMGEAEREDFIAFLLSPNHLDWRERRLK